LTRHLKANRLRPQRVPPTIPAGSARVQLLWPTGESTTLEALEENDRSLVCLIEFAGRRVLLCSDIEKAAQQEILKRHPSLKADVVVVPHHGSIRTLNDDFIRHLEPTLLLCSCGRTDYERGRVIAAPRAGSLPESQATALWVTARDGAVTVRMDRAGVPYFVLAAVPAAAGPR
jgi:competence protein ComEC